MKSKYFIPQSVLLMVLVLMLFVACGKRTEFIETQVDFTDLAESEDFHDVEETGNQTGEQPVESGDSEDSLDSEERLSKEVEIESRSESLVNINKADEAQLMSLWGIGAVRAEAIIAYRESHGDFTKTEDLMKVYGIGEGIYERVKDSITVN